MAVLERVQERVQEVRENPTGRRVAALLIIAGIAVWGCFLYSLAHHTYLPQSDNAGAVLAGHDMVTGNPLLDDWILPEDTYWTVDLPLYGLFSLFAGVGPIAVYAVPVLVAVALIGLAAMAAREGLPRRDAWVAAGVVVLLLGLPHPFQARFFLQGPLHITTTLYCLVAFWVLWKASNPRRWALAVVLLGVVVVGDPYALAVGVAPIAAAGVASGLRQRRWEPAVAGGVVAAVAAGGAKVVGLALDHLPAHTLAEPLPLSPAWNWRYNARGAVSRFASLLGTGPLSDLSGLWRAAHAVGLAVVVVAVAGTFALLLSGALRGSPGEGRMSSWRWSVGRSWFDDVLLFGFLGSLAAYVIVVLPQHRADVPVTRYLLPALVYGAVLAGRRLGGAARRVPRRAVPILAAVLVVVTGVYGWASIRALHRPADEDPAVALVRWLDDNGLKAGFGQYWSASIVTVTSRDKITVRPVEAKEDGLLRPKPYYTSADWYRADRRKPRNFVVYQPTEQPLDDVDENTATSTFGPPTRTADVGPYRVLIWPDDVTPRLRPGLY